MSIGALRPLVVLLVAAPKVARRAQTYPGKRLNKRTSNGIVYELLVTVRHLLSMASVAMVKRHIIRSSKAFARVGGYDKPQLKGYPIETPLRSLVPNITRIT